MMHRFRIVNICITNDRQIIGTQNHILRGRSHRTAVFGVQNIIRRKHQQTRLGLRLGRKRHMHSHLVTVKVGVISRTNQRVNFQSAALNQNRLKSLNTQAVQRRRTVQQNWVFTDNVLQNVPNLRPHTLHHAFGAFDIMRHTVMHKPFHHKGLKQLQRHFLGQAALMHLQFRANHDNGTAGIVNTFTQQVLAETPLLAFQQIRKRFQRTVAWANHRPAAAAVINQRVHRFLQHTLLVAHNNIRRAQIQQAAQAVITVNYPAIQVVQITGGETTAVQLYHRAQFRRNNRYHVQNHPFRAVAALQKGLHNLQTANSFNFALTGNFFQFRA